MGIFVPILKINMIDDLHFYKIDASEFGEGFFFAMINSSNNEISYYKNEDFFEKPIKVININDKNTIISIPGFSNKLSSKVLSRFYEALKIKCFPYDLSYRAK